MFATAWMPDAVRSAAFSLLLCVLGPVACGSDSGISAASGAAVNMTGSFKGTAFTVRDAASVSIPVGSVQGLKTAVLAIVYADTMGICQQANTSFDPNATIYLAILDDQTGNANPTVGTYGILTTDNTNPQRGSGDAGYGWLVGIRGNDSLSADDGEATLTQVTSDTSEGYAEGAFVATLSGTTLLSGRFEAPECDALAPLALSVLGY